jgi:hypothetical protein
MMISLCELSDVDAKKVGWSKFAEYHYSPDVFNVAARTFFAYDDADTLIGLTAALALPSGTMRNAWRSHKVVVLPEYRELWGDVADAQAAKFVAEGKRYFCNASDAPEDLIAYRDDPASGWRCTSKHGQVPRDRGHSAKFGNKSRAVNSRGIVISHEFVGCTEKSCKE